MSRKSLLLALCACALGGSAWAADPGLASTRLSGAMVVTHATPVVQAIMALLGLSIVTAAALWAIQAIQGDRADPARRARRLAMLSAIAASAPLLGLTAAAYTVLNCFIGIANVRPSPDLATLAPGLAEATMSVMLGLLAAALAAGARRVLDAPARPQAGHGVQAAAPHRA